MRVLFLGNNRVAWRVASYLAEHEEIVGLVLHPPERRKYGDEILSATHVAPSAVFDATKLDRPDVLEAVRGLRPDIGVSVYFGYIVRRSFLDCLPQGCLNVHPAYLPYNRGAYPNVWGIVDRTPVGATIHYMDEGVDTGDVVDQVEVPVDPTDTGGTLYRRLEQACVELFERTWPKVATGRAARTLQPRDGGTFHRVRDAESLDEIRQERTYVARELLDIIRARTFPPYPGAYFVHEGRKIYMRLQLLTEDELSGPEHGSGD